MSSQEGQEGLREEPPSVAALDLYQGFNPLTFVSAWDFSIEGYNLHEPKASHPFVLPDGVAELRQAVMPGATLPKHVLDSGRADKFHPKAATQIEAAIAGKGLMLNSMRIFKEVYWSSQVAEGNKIEWFASKQEATFSLSAVYPMMLLVHDTGKGYVYRTDDGFMLETYRTSLREKTKSIDIPGDPGEVPVKNEPCGPCLKCFERPKPAPQNKNIPAPAQGSPDCFSCCRQFCPVESPGRPARPGMRIGGKYVIGAEPGWRLTITSMEAMHEAPLARKDIRNKDHSQSSPWTYVLDFSLQNDAEDIYKLMASLRAEGTRKPFALEGVPQVVEYTQPLAMERVLPQQHGALPTPLEMAKPPVGTQPEMGGPAPNAN